MTPHGGAVRLLVLLGVALASGGPLHFISDSLRLTHGSIADELELKLPAVGLHPLFSSVLQSINNSCLQNDAQLINATLDVYTRIFSSILPHGHHKTHGKGHASGLLEDLPEPKRSKVTSALKELKKLLDDLKRHLNRPVNDNKEAVLRELSEMQVDDTMVQRKALAEFIEVYQAASVVSSYKC
ncbi:uncharacterized protein ACNS7B_001270 isoform 2-T2 [Menidia menidia]